MFNIENLPNTEYSKVVDFFEKEDYPSIIALFLEYNVILCDSCANNYAQIQAWMNYWVGVNYFGNG